MIEQHFPGCGWLRLPRETLDALLAFRSRRALPSWEATVEALLATADAAEPAPARGSSAGAARPPRHREDRAVTGPRSPAETEARFALARQVADAVLFEGYVLYPYRASAAKNRLRWQFGVLVPPGWGAESEEHAFQRTECLMEPRAGATLSVELRFLHAQRRTVQRACAGRRLRDGRRTRTARPGAGALGRGRRGARRAWSRRSTNSLGDGVTVPSRAPPARRPSRSDADGRTVGRLVRRCEEVSGPVRLTASELDGPYRGACG